MQAFSVELLLVVFAADSLIPQIMLDAQSPAYQHVLQNAFLIILSLLFLPLNTLIVAASLVWRRWSRSTAGSPQDSQQHGRTKHTPRTVLVTGVGMTKGLSIAREFHNAGHRVIGADFEPEGAVACGRASVALHAFYRLGSPAGSSDRTRRYVEDLVGIVREEGVELWISCSGVASAIEDGVAKEVLEREGLCESIQFGVEETRRLHEKSSFMDYTKALALTIPATYTVASRADALEILQSVPREHSYIMKCVGVDDSSRADMTLLPRSTTTETEKHLGRLNISDLNPWIIQQYIKGEEFCTHALVVKGRVRAFVACPSAELLMHYEPLPSESPLSQAMLRFTEAFAKAGGSNFTGHLSFDFLVEDTRQPDPANIVLYPIECNPRAHTAVALFAGTPGFVKAYLSIFDGKEANDLEPVVFPLRQDKVYWLGHDLIELMLLPLRDFLLAKIPLAGLLQCMRLFCTHLLYWKDGTFELRDPLPYWVLYHVYWPSRFLNMLLTDQRWSRINVSTTKVFVC